MSYDYRKQAVEILSMCDPGSCGCGEAHEFARDEAEREELITDMAAALDGTNASVISLISGLSREELDDLGGVPE